MAGSYEMRSDSSTWVEDREGELLSMICCRYYVFCHVCGRGLEFSFLIHFNARFSSCFTKINVLKWSVLEFRDNFFDYRNAICRNLSVLLHVAQRAARFCELEVQATLAFGLALSSNIELCRYLVDHLEVLRFCGEDRTSSFLQLVEIVDKIYSHSSSLSSPLKKLTIFVDADPPL